MTGIPYWLERLLAMDGKRNHKDVMFGAANQYGIPVTSFQTEAPPGIAVCARNTLK